MKRILSLLLLLLTLNVFGQSVAGVSLGDGYDNVERTLEQRYGSTIFKEYNEILYQDISIGGITYDFSKFYFVYRPEIKERRLNQVYLSSYFKLSELNKAKSHRDYIASIYAKKYNDIEERIDDDGFKYYVCSYNPYSDFYRIGIFLYKEESKGGETFYYVGVSYGPYYKSSSLDDI